MEGWTWVEFCERNESCLPTKSLKISLSWKTLQCICFMYLFCHYCSFEFFFFFHKIYDFQVALSISFGLLWETPLELRSCIWSKFVCVYASKIDSALKPTSTNSLGSCSFAHLYRVMTSLSLNNTVNSMKMPIIVFRRRCLHGNNQALICVFFGLETA